MFSVSGELISETRSIIIAHRFGTFRTFRPFRDILDILPVLGHLGHFGHFARFETFGTNRTFWTKRKAAALLSESAAWCIPSMSFSFGPYYHLAYVRWDCRRFSNLLKDCFVYSISVCVGHSAIVIHSPNFKLQHICINHSHKIHLFTACLFSYCVDANVLLRRCKF